MLEVKKLSKSFNGKKVLDDVSFKVDAGEILGIIGMNGAGKSTCVTIIATILKPDSGQILFEGEDIAKDPEIIRQSMGYVPQDVALYETLSGRDNLMFWGKSYGVEKDRMEAEIKRVCSIIGFDEELLAKKVAEYSGGMKRRLNIGAALLHRPKLVILDEPTTGIDLTNSTQIVDSIISLKNEGTAVIYVGHYMEEVERVSTHLCLLEDGKVIACGPKKELLEGADGPISLSGLYLSRH